MRDIEDNVRDGLRGYVATLVPDDTPVPNLPGPRRSKGAPLVVAAAIALLITAAIAMPRVLGAGPNVQQVAAQQSADVSIAPNQIQVQGAVIPVPTGWHAQDASSTDSDLTGAFRFCLLPAGTRLGQQSCLDTGGILIKVARVSAHQLTQAVQGGITPHCADAVTVPILEPGQLGAAKASVVTITCGSDTASSSTYWQNDDRTFTMQTTYNGDQSLSVAQFVAQQTDLSQWVHRG